MRVEDPTVNLYEFIHSRIEKKTFIDEFAIDFERVSDDILKDIPRTSVIGKTGWLRTGLSRVLLAVAYAKPSIGYCQGMNFIAGVLLRVLESEEVAF